MVLIFLYLDWIQENKARKNSVFGHFTRSVQHSFTSFQPSVTFHIETSYLVCTANQMTGFYMECNTGRCSTVTGRCSVKSVLNNFTRFTEKHLCWSPFFNKDAGFRPATLFRKKLQHRPFPVSFMKFLRTHILQNTSFGCFWKLGWNGLVP